MLHTDSCNNVNSSFDRNQSKKECKDQESIQSSNTPDPGHHLGNWQKHNIEESQEIKSFPTGDLKAASNWDGSMAKINTNNE